jgi:hypothetical protein
MRITLVAIILVVVIGGTVLLFSTGEKRHHNWTVSYSPGSREPYGTWVIKKLLDSHVADHSLTISNQPLTEALPDSGSYLFIGSGMSLTRDDTDSLEGFIRRGNTALLVTDNLPQRILCRMLGECGSDIMLDSEPSQRISLSLDPTDFPTARSYAVTYFEENELETWWWSYFDSVGFGWRVIGWQSGTFPNFVEVPLGEGRVYIHTTPLVFTNIALLEKQMLEYDQRVLSYLSTGDIYWDKARRGRLSDLDELTFFEDESTFAYILSQPSLRWAWYLLISLGVIFVIFRSKRTQRVVPVVEQNVNTYLEFVKVMGRLYRSQNDHRRMTEMQMNQFLAYARDQYRISTQDDQPDLITRMASKSQVPVTDINRIFAMHSTLSGREHVSPDDVIEFHRLLQGFYMKAK